jgi:hypothetical protein
MTKIEQQSFDVSAKEKIDSLMANHDDDIEGSVTQLLTLVPDEVETADLRRLSWLINHVVGELSSRWSDALSLQKKFARHDEPAQAASNRSVAATLAGAPLDAWHAERAFAAVAGCSAEAASIALRLALLQFLAGRDDLSGVVRELIACEAELKSRGDFGGLERFLAPALNNLTTALIERGDATITDDAYRAAVTDGADLAAKAWSLTGTWVNWERAEYLRALTANLLRNWQVAHDAATRGLALIEANGMEDVDRAFLLVELGRAQRGLGDLAGAEQSAALAAQLAAAFQQPSLHTWFADRVRIARADYP